LKEQVIEMLTNNDNNKYLKNIPLFSRYRFWINMMIIGPILIPFMLFKGLNYTQILLLQSISALAVFIFEVPTGSIADKISRKFSLVLGSVSLIIGLALYIFFQSFYIFALAEIIFGLGLTFNSGADSAILYESLSLTGKKEEYQNAEGHSSSLVFIGQAVGSIFSSILYTKNEYLPFLISLVFMSFSIFYAIRFIEPKRTKSEHNYLSHVFKSFEICFKTPRLLWLLCFAVFMGFALRISFWLYQPYFELAKIDIFWYGMIFCFFNLVAAFASKYIGAKFYERRPRHILLVLALLITVSFLIPIVYVSPFMIVILALQQIVRGMYSTTSRFYINHQVEDSKRATIISVISLAGSIGFAVLSPLTGKLLDIKGAKTSYFCVGLFCLISLLLLFILRKSQKSKKKNRF